MDTLTRFRSRRLPGAALLLGAMLASACVTAAPETATSAMAQPQTESLAAAAQEAYTAEDWGKVVELYRQLTAEEPGSGRYWYRLAVGLRYTGEFDQAHQALDAAAKVNVPVSYTDYERAKIAATQHKNAEAMKLLNTAANAGLAGSDRVLENEHLAALAGEPGFDALLEQLETNKYPCRDSKFHEFDFWIGEWQIASADGQLGGTNSIQALEQHCLIMERWTATDGTTGTSMNFFDLSKGRWVQQWVSSGSQIHIEGGLVDGSMVLTGFIRYIRNNQHADFRGKWTPMADGRVRQFFEQADADGNWTPWFEGFYTRIDAAK